MLKSDYSLKDKQVTYHCFALKYWNYVVSILEMIDIFGEIINSWVNTQPYFNDINEIKMKIKWLLEL